MCALPLFRPSRLPPQECNIHNGAELHLYLLAEDGSQALSNAYGIIPHESSVPASLARVLAEVHEGFREGLGPKMAEAGQGGTYFLFNCDGKAVACFKPLDEEPFTPNNCKGWVGPVGG